MTVQGSAESRTPDSAVTQTDGIDTARRTEEWYAEFYKDKGTDRNDLLRNPEVLFQFLAHEASMISAARLARFDPATHIVLDVGCGGGFGLSLFATLGARPDRLYGVDIQESRVQIARDRLPTARISCGDASRLEFPDGFFDVVTESTMFVQLTDEHLAQRIAGEMIRVTRPGGFVLLADWRYSRPGDRRYVGLSASRIHRLFGVPGRTEVRAVIRGALIPPVGRFLSKYCHALYFPVAALLPPLVGQVVTVLQKRSD